MQIFKQLLLQEFRYFIVVAVVVLTKSCALSIWKGRDQQLQDLEIDETMASILFLLITFPGDCPCEKIFATLNLWLSAPCFCYKWDSNSLLD